MMCVPVAWNAELVSEKTIWIWIMVATEDSDLYSTALETLKSSIDRIKGAIEGELIGEGEIKEVTENREPLRVSAAGLDEAEEALAASPVIEPSQMQVTTVIMRHHYLPKRRLSPLR